MTKEEIMAMEAGRILDAQVGEKVMGLDLVEDTLPYLPKHYHPDYDRTIFSDVPRYSADISAAWKVLEKIRETHCYRFHDMGRNMHKDEPHVAILLPSGKGWEFGVEARAATLPLAICKAALLAVMES